MLGVDTFIVQNDDLSKLAKSMEDLDCNEKDDNSNEKNGEVKVSQRTLNDIFGFGGRKKFSFRALACKIAHT